MEQEPGGTEGEVGAPAPAAPRTPVRTLDARPSRATSIAVGAAAVVAVVFAVTRGPRRIVRDASDCPAPTVVTESSAEEQLQRAMADLQALPPMENPGTAKLLEALEEVQPSNVGRKMPDGSDPPPLPPGAPKRVRFGLVLVRYRGAQLAPKVAPTREVALQQAQLLAKLAKDDFPAAVRAGDPGSVVDVGSVKRGVLEQAIEYTLFTLPVGWVSDVVDTPRGFWIMKRLK